MRDLSRRTLLALLGSGATPLFAGRSASDTTALNPEATGTATKTSETAHRQENIAKPRQRARDLIALIRRNAYKQAHSRFAPALAKQVSPNQLQQVWTGLEEQNGEFRSLSQLESTAQDEATVVTGTITFERGQANVTVVVGKDAITGLRFQPASSNWSPPTYVDESSFIEREISLHATNDCSLGGVLTVPQDVSHAPGVVLVHGQGPSDRDGTVGPNKPYKDLAWGLASRGIAVLRYDKRAQACEPNLAEITIDQAVTNDAVTAIDRLRETAIVENDTVFVVGHSIGATLAPRIASRDGNLAGIVMLAPLARSAADAIIDQNQYLVSRDGNVTEAEEQQLEQVYTITDQIRSLNFPDEKVVYLGGDEYWRTLQEYNPLQTAECLRIPQQILQGERDYQVTIDGDFSQWQEALAGKSNVQFNRYSKLNHLFMPGTGKPGFQEYMKENHVAKPVVADITSFIIEQ